MLIWKEWRSTQILESKRLPKIHHQLAVWRWKVHSLRPRTENEVNNHACHHTAVVRIKRNILCTFSFTKNIYLGLLFQRPRTNKSIHRIREVELKVIKVLLIFFALITQLSFFISNPNAITEGKMWPREKFINYIAILHLRFMFISLKFLYP